jgi:hypothetical protein
MKINLGLEALNPQDAAVQFSEESFVDMQIAEEELNLALEETKALMDSYEMFVNLLDTVEEHGSYAGFESMIADKAQLDQLLGFDICTASVEQLKDLYSNETVADALNKFGAKIEAFFGRIGDSVNNFIKTLLPYKEKYLKELTEMKRDLSGRSFDEEKFADTKVASAMKKDQYTSFTKALKDAHDAIVKAVNYASDLNIDQYLESVDDIPGTMRTSLWGTVQWRPFFSWFKSNKAGKLGFKATDAAGVVDSYISIINGVADLHGLFGKWLSAMKSLETKQSYTRASGDKEKAKEIRKAIANLNNFYFTLSDSIRAYETTVRRGMYFATYLGRAAKQCIKTN